MLRMIIADDESIVRRGLKNIIGWEKYGIEIIAEAADGQEALDLSLALHPDILFTDIRMPMMDGLEVAMKLEEQGSGIRVVFISGAQDFNYVKTALNVNAEGYVLKPVEINELEGVMEKVVNRIKLERNRQSEMTQLKQQLNDHFPLIRENFLRNLVQGNYSDELEIEDKLQYLKIPFNADDSLLISMLQIDDYGKVTETMTEEDKQLLRLSIANIAAEIMTNSHAGISFCIHENEYVLLFNQAAQCGRKYIEYCEESVTCMNRILNISVSIGIGRSVSRLLSAGSSYKDARTALQYKFYTGKNSILDINDIISINSISSNADHPDSSGLNEYENRLMNSIRLGDSAAVVKIVETIFKQLCSDRGTPADYVQSICAELVFVASRTVQDLGESLDSIVSKRSLILDTIYKKECMFDLEAYVSSVFSRLADYFSRKYNQKNSKVINQIKEIIENRYHEDISVSKISDEVYLTPNYISLIFKQETGETITEYITKIRMEHAKNLLKSTRLKILEIAEKVGYEDPHYFSKAFKKYTGVHPQKYQS